jgi:hypothetical protein
MEKRCDYWLGVGGIGFSRLAAKVIFAALQATVIRTAITAIRSILCHWLRQRDHPDAFRHEPAISQKRTY